MRSRSRSGSRTRRIAPATRPGTLLLVACMVLAACGSGKSALEAGNDDPPPVVTVAPPEASGDDTDAPNAGTLAPSDEPDGTSDPPDTADPATTEPSPTTTDDVVGPAETGGSTTTVAPLAGLPPCPTDALDDADGPVDVTFWHGLGNELEAALIAIVDDYNASQDRVVVDLQNQVSYEAIVDKYIQGSTDSRPEVVQLPEYVVQAFAQSDSVVPVAACVESSGFDTGPILPGALSTYLFEGIQWGMPFNLSGPVLYYNRLLFEAAGLDPDDPPVTLDELRQVSQVLVDAGEAGVGIAVDSGRDSGGGWFFEQWFARAGEPYADNGNGRIAPATRVLFNNDLGVELLTFLQTMIADGLAESVGDNPGGIDAFLALIDQSAPAAMTIATSAALSSVLAFIDGGAAPGLGQEDLGVGPMPGPSDVPSTQVGGASLWIPAGKSDVETAASWDFIEYLVAAQTQSTWAAATGYVPIRSDALDLDPIRATYDDDPRFRVAYDQVLAAADDPSAAVPALGPLREVRAQTADAVAAVYAGADVEQVLADTEAAANALIANYNARN